MAPLSLALRLTGALPAGAEADYAARRVARAGHWQLAPAALFTPLDAPARVYAAAVRRLAERVVSADAVPARQLVFGVFEDRTSKFSLQVLVALAARSILASSPPGTLRFSAHAVRDRAAARLPLIAPVRPLAAPVSRIPTPVKTPRSPTMRTSASRGSLSSTGSEPQPRCSEVVVTRAEEVAECVLPLSVANAWLKLFNRILTAAQSEVARVAQESQLVQTIYQFTYEPPSSGESQPPASRRLAFVSFYDSQSEAQKYACLRDLQDLLMFLHQHVDFEYALVEQLVSNWERFLGGARPGKDDLETLVFYNTNLHDPHVIDHIRIVQGFQEAFASKSGEASPTPTAATSSKQLPQPSTTPPRGGAKRSQQHSPISSSGATSPSAIPLPKAAAANKQLISKLKQLSDLSTGGGGALESGSANSSPADSALPQWRRVSGSAVQTPKADEDISRMRTRIDDGFRRVLAYSEASHDKIAVTTPTPQHQIQWQQPLDQEHPGRASSSSSLLLSEQQSAWYKQTITSLHAEIEAMRGIYDSKIHEIKVRYQRKLDGAVATNKELMAVAEEATAELEKLDRALAESQARVAASEEKMRVMKEVFDAAMAERSERMAREAEEQLGRRPAAIKRDKEEELFFSELQHAELDRRDAAIAANEARIAQYAAEVQVLSRTVAGYEAKLKQKDATIDALNTQVQQYIKTYISDIAAKDELIRRQSAELDEIATERAATASEVSGSVGGQGPGQQQYSPPMSQMSQLSFGRGEDG